MRTNRIGRMALVLASALGCAAHAAERKETGKAMEAAVVDLLTQLEKDLPLTAAKLTARLGVGFKTGRDHNRKKRLEFKGEKPLAPGLVVTGVFFRAAEGEDPGDFSLTFEPVKIDAEALARLLPGGSWLPPPPPGYAPPDAAPAYCVTRSWGRVFFGFSTAGLRSMGFDIGVFGSPGV
jgi:hypothetical protein